MFALIKIWYKNNNHWYSILIIKTVPVIICRPIIKLTKVVSKTTTDVSNALDPRNKLENQKVLLIYFLLFK